jgi:hypothetical protein
MITEERKYGGPKRQSVRMHWLKGVNVLPLISQFVTHFWSSQERVFSLLNEYRRETWKGDKRGEGYECTSCTKSGCKSIVFFLERKLKMIGCHLWVVGLCGIKVPTLANLRFFTPNPFSRNGNWTFINVQF